MAVVLQGIEGEKKGRMVIGCGSVLRLGHGNTKTLLSFFPNNIGAKHFLRAKTLNSSNLTHLGPCIVPRSSITPALSLPLSLTLPLSKASAEAVEVGRLGGSQKPKSRPLASCGPPCQSSVRGSPCC